jgi:hypothetical protein
VGDQPVHKLAREGRVRDDRIGRAIGIDRKGILSSADVALPNAAQTKRFQMPDQIAITSARFCKGVNAVQVRNQRHHRRPGRRIEISLAAFEVGSFAHLGFSLTHGGGVARLRIRPPVVVTNENDEGNRPAQGRHTREATWDIIFPSNKEEVMRVR